MSNPKLPESFIDLEPLAAVWALATETERNQQRLTSTMTQIQAFYDTMLPRMKAVLTYLSQFSIEPIPDQAAILSEDAQRLLYLSLAMAEVTTAVELYQQPGVPDGFDPRRFIADHERVEKTYR